MKKKSKKRYKETERIMPMHDEMTTYDTSRSETSTPQKVREANEPSAEYKRLKTSANPK